MKSGLISGLDPATGKPLQISIEDGRIRGIENGPLNESAWLAAGFIDLQVNGYLGCDLNADGVDADVVIALTRKMLSVGVTTFLPTLITASEDRIIESLCAIAEARQIDSTVAHAIPFIHVEGPYISPEDGPRGAHPREHVRPASLAEFDRWQAACGNLVGMVTISPHDQTALDYVLALSKRGVLLAIGHTDATPEQIRAAVDAGATLSTHLGNGIRNQLPRHPNPLWTQLAEDRLTATFIADGHHLPTDTFQVMLRAKGIDRSVLVSDTVALSGLPVGIYETPVGGAVKITPDRRIMSADGGQFLAGAYRPLIDGVAYAANLQRHSLGDAVRMATENPGSFVGGRGTLRIGEVADLVRFQWNPGEFTLKLLTIMHQGQEAEAM